MRLPISQETLSEYARNAYAQSGRGVVIAKEGEPFETPDGPVLATVLLYLNEGSDLYVRSGGWPSPGVERFVREYDPEAECVLLELNEFEDARATIVPLVD